MLALFSSNINEGMKAFLFLLRKDFTRKKSTKTHINEQKQNKKKKTVLNVLKKHLRGRKSLVRLHALLCFLCAFFAFCTFCAFLRVKQ